MQGLKTLLIQRQGKPAFTLSHLSGASVAAQQIRYH
jgi:hypothetical protein